MPSEGTSFGKLLKSTSQLPKPVGVGFAQAGTVAAAARAPFEPSDLRTFEVLLSTRSEERLELGVEDRHFNIFVVQPAIGADGLLVSRFGLGAVEACRLDGGAPRRLA
jgi:hypothetical protein